MLPLPEEVRTPPCTHDQGIGADHLGALAGLPRLTKLNLYHLHWAEDAVELGLGWLAARLPYLKILNAPSDVLVRPWCFLRGNAPISKGRYQVDSAASVLYSWCVCCTFQHQQKAIFYYSCIKMLAAMHAKKG